MKRKLVERTEPKAPVVELEHQVITTQTVEGILVLNIFAGGILRARYAMNTQTYEYEVLENGIWKQEKFEFLWTGQSSSYWGCMRERDVLFDTTQDRDIIKEMIKADHWRADVIDLIDHREWEYNLNSREAKERRRLDRVRETMDKIPPLPENLRDWILDRTGRPGYLFFDRETKEWACISCKGRTPEKELRREDGGKARHGDIATCPHCGRKASVVRRTTEKKMLFHFCLIQPVDEEMGAARHFDAEVSWGAGGESARISEAIRILLYKPASRKYRKWDCDIYYNQYTRDMSWGTVKNPGKEYFDNRGNSSNRRTYHAYLYDGGIQEALKDTAYEGWTRIFKQMAAENRHQVHYNALMACGETKMPALIELLYKGRFYRLLKEEAEKISTMFGGYNGVLGIKGNSIEEVFKIRDRQKINRIRDMDGGSNAALWMQWSDTTGQKINQETLEWLGKEGIVPEDIKGIGPYMGIQQIQNYLIRQQAESYPGLKIKAVLSQWIDYLEMTKKLGKHMDDAMVYRPRELRRRHDEAVMELEARKAEITANEYAERFPGVEDVMAEIREKYEYESDQYIITVPRRCMDIVVEGRMLHHCAGACDRYFDRIRQRETYICFLRRAEAPDMPYYTIEVEPGGTIRQHRGMYDEEPGIEEIRPFLREWQQVIKRRITEQDRHYARISAVKREENIKDLEAKNNTRVLQGLMEDFMEAI